MAHIPEGSARVDLDAGTASLHAENICVFDAFTVANSVNLARPLGNLVKGIVNSLDIQWSGANRRVNNFSDSANQFRGSFVENTAAIQVTATTPVSTGHGFRFVSSATVSSNFAQIGQESNGSFF